MAQQTDFTLLVDAFRQNYTTNVDISKARLKAARQQPNQDIASFLCDVRTLARRAYRAFPHLVEQIVLTSFIEGLSDSTLRWELRKSKPATADDALTMAMELNSFLEIEKGAPPPPQASESAVNLVSRNPPEQLSNDLMNQFVRTLAEKLNKAIPLQRNRAILDQVVLNPIIANQYVSRQTIREQKESEQPTEPRTLA